MSYLKQFWRFLVKSSADPRRTSLTVKALLLGLVTITSGEIVQALDLVCEFGYHCYYFDPGIMDNLRAVVDRVVYGVYILLVGVAFVTGTYGALRKFLLTFAGANRALWED